jgi:hypothetical protein
MKGSNKQPKEKKKPKGFNKKDSLKKIRKEEKLK